MDLWRQCRRNEQGLPMMMGAHPGAANRRSCMLAPICEELGIPLTDLGPPFAAASPRLA